MTLEAYQIRKWVSLTEEINHDGGEPLAQPMLRAAAGVIIANPFAGRYVEDLAALQDPSAALGTALGERAVALLKGRPAVSYGKGGIAGVNGEQEHVVACITTLFGDALRAAVGGGEAWVSSASKVAAAGTPLDIPLAHKDALYVRAQYDAITFAVPDGPRPDELLIVVADASAGRPPHRVGGLNAEDIKGGGLV
jgi:hypothetical protein